MYNVFDWQAISTANNRADGPVRFISSIIDFKYCGITRGNIHSQPLYAPLNWNIVRPG